MQIIRSAGKFERLQGFRQVTTPLRVKSNFKEPFGPSWMIACPVVGVRSRRFNRKHTTQHPPQQKIMLTWSKWADGGPFKGLNRV